MYLGEPLFNRYEFAVRAGGHVAIGQRVGKLLRRRLKLQAQDLSKSAFAGFDDGAGVVGDQSAEHVVGALVPGAVELVQARDDEIGCVADASAEIASELRRGADYVRVTLALTVLSTDVTDALAIAWDAFRSAARDDLTGWEVTSAAAEVTQEPSLIRASCHAQRCSPPSVRGQAARARGTRSPSNRARPVAEMLAAPGGRAHNEPDRMLFPLIRLLLTYPCSILAR
jgi:hypothetical protein